MFIWCRLNTFDDLFIPFHHHIIPSHSFLLSLSTRTALYHQSFCPLNGELCLCHSEVNHSQCWSVGEGSPTSHPSHQSHSLGSPTLAARSTTSSASARVRTCFLTWQKRPGRMERIHVITLQLWARLNSEMKSLKTHFLCFHYLKLSTNRQQKWSFPLFSPWK